MPQFFYVDNLEKNKEIFLSQEESHHTKVLRKRIGDEIKVFDSFSNQYKGKIKRIENNKVLVYLQEKIENNKSKNIINLYFPFIERSNFEDIIKKGTEIGVYSFTPIITEFTQKNYIFNIKEKINRLREILISALKQSERPLFPIINEPIRFEEIFSNTKNIITLSKKLSNGKTSLNLIEVIKDMYDNFSLVVGPEGGFSKEELKLAENKSYIANIGDFILRTETACIVGSALLSLKK